MPWAQIPPGQMVELPGRGGATYVTDTPGPSPDSPTLVLLHALGCTGLLTWYPAIEPLSRRYRVVTLDLRWHGQGIQSEEFSLYDCADDVAALIDVLELEDVIVCGYSLGSIVAQRVWRQHPEKIQGLVLCATTDRFQLTPSERLFFAGMGTAMFGARGISRSRTALTAARAAARAARPRALRHPRVGAARVPLHQPVGGRPGAGALGQHHSRPWIAKIDVPTAVVVGTKDRVIQPERQFSLARAIPGATVHDVEAGHAMCVLEAEKFVPVVVEAINTVNARRRDFAAGAGQDARTCPRSSRPPS